MKAMKLESKYVSRFFLGFSLLLIAVTIWTVSGPQQKSDVETPFANINREAIKELKVKVKGQDLVRALWDGENWQLKQPVAELADQYSVESFVSWLLEMEMLKLSRIDDWHDKESPMTDLLGQIEIHTLLGEVIQLQIGMTRSVEGYYYLTRKGNAHIYLSTAAIEKQITRRDYFFRNRRLLPDNGELLELSIEASGKEKILLRAQGLDWQVKQGADFVFASRRKVERTIFELKNLSIDRFYSEKIDVAQRKKFQLDKQLLTIGLKIKAKDQNANETIRNWKLFISEEVRHQVYATTNERNFVVGINSLGVRSYRGMTAKNYLPDPVVTTKDL